MDNKIVESEVYPLQTLFQDKFDVDFYQREYVWQLKQIEDLISDLSVEFLKNYKPEHEYGDVSKYDPYYMGEIVLSVKSGQRSSIIDGQQRITTLTLLLIYLVSKYKDHPDFPDELNQLIYSNHFGTKMFNLDIEERRECMLSLYNTGSYVVKETDSISVKNIVERYNDIENCWIDSINDSNIIHFIYWIMSKVMFSKVWTNSDEFAYVIFETMNDRGLSLTQVEMLRSYILANITTINSERDKAMDLYDEAVKRLMGIKLSTKSKAEFEFFKMYFRGHYAEDVSQSKNSNSDFIRIGKEFHRWIRDNSKKLLLEKSDDFKEFVNRISYYSIVYEKIHSLIQKRDTTEFLYLVVNNDYGFTLQPAAIMASIAYNDSNEIIEEKIKIVSKYLTKVLSWRIWNHWVTSQSALEAPVYDLCVKIRDMSVGELKEFLATDPIELPKLENSPTLNHQNRQKLKVLLALITEIVARESGESDYILKKETNVEVEHIWANHYERHIDEFSNEADFANTRNNIGDLLVLPKSFNASYGDEPYSVKVQLYFSQNILAQTLNSQKYSNSPGFIQFIDRSKLDIKPYDAFTKNAIQDRAELYKNILLWNWNN